MDVLRTFFGIWIRPIWAERRVNIVWIRKRFDRINELAKKARTPEGLTPEETQERAALRREYIDTVVGNLARELDNTWVVDENGNKRKLRKRGEENTHD